MVKKDEEKDDWGTPGEGTGTEQNPQTQKEPTEEDKEKARIAAEMEKRKKSEADKKKKDAAAKKKADTLAKAKAKDKIEPKPDPQPEPAKRVTMPGANSVRSASAIKKSIKILTERYNKIVLKDDETATLVVKGQLDALTWALNATLTDEVWLRF